MLLNAIIHPEVEPGVIDNAMLSNAILEQGPKGEEGRLFAEQGVSFEKTTSIKLEFKRILRIDHLWMLTSLTKLCLAHNLIEKIKNLHQLVNLVELDLSFNKIEKIENLDKLVKLEVLSLFHNQISVLENLDTLTELLILSIGDNLITDYKQLEYLRKFRKLRSLSFRGNPCLEQWGADAFSYAVLPNLTYLDYKRLTEEQREDGISKHRGHLRLLDEQDEIAERQRIIDEERQKMLEYYTILYMEGLQGYDAFESFFEGSVILEWCKENRDVAECFDGYKERTLGITTDLVEFAEVIYNKREAQLRCFDEVMETALSDNVAVGQTFPIVLVEEYKTEKIPLFKLLDDQIHDVKSKVKTMDEAEDAVLKILEPFEELLNKLWRQLMEKEMTVYECCQITLVQLAENLRDSCDDLVIHAKEAFRDWRKVVQQFTEDFYEVINGIIADSKLYFLSEENIRIMSDEEELLAIIDAHNQTALNYIDARLETLEKRITKWTEHQILTANENELNRNRSRIVEINYFLDNEREQWNEKQSELTEKPDAVTAAILGEDF